MIILYCCSDETNIGMACLALHFHAHLVFYILLFSVDSMALSFLLISLFTFCSLLVLMTCCLDFSKVSPHKFVKEEEEPKGVSDSEITNRANETNASSRPNSDAETDGFKARKFALVDLVAATENFKEEFFLGEGGFGRVYKGHLKDSGEVS